MKKKKKQKKGKIKIKIGRKDKESSTRITCTQLPIIKFENKIK